jgi:hypothetical protein
MLVGAVVIAAAAGCTPTPTVTQHDFGASPDGGVSAAAQRNACPDGYALCEQRCCPDGTQCVAGECRYPYSTAHLFVWLCPSFGQGCSSNFFELDQMCSPLTKDAVAGTCYDTGLQVAASQTYALTTCMECGNNCGSPASFNTPPGFLGADWHSGFAYWCGEHCTAPPTCGGPSAGSGSGGASGTGTSGASGGSSSSSMNGSATAHSTHSDGGTSTADAGADAEASGGPGLCATSAAGKCVKCSGPDDPVCGPETCCSSGGLAFCTDLTVAACIGCMSDHDCDPGVPCCH